MATAEEIEAAIRSLPQPERAKLVKDLPSILSELSGDTEWERIITDPRPRPALTKLGDELEAQLNKNPGQSSLILDPPEPLISFRQLHSQFGSRFFDR